MDATAKTQLQEQRQSLIAAEERFYETLAAYLATEHADLIKAIADALGDDVTAETIARAIDHRLFLEPGDAWIADVRSRLVSAAFGFSA